MSRWRAAGGARELFATVDRWDLLFGLSPMRTLHLCPQGARDVAKGIARRTGCRARVQRGTCIGVGAMQPHAAWSVAVGLAHHLAVQQTCRVPRSLDMGSLSSQIAQLPDRTNNPMTRYLSQDSRDVRADLSSALTTTESSDDDDAAEHPAYFPRAQAQTLVRPAVQGRGTLGPFFCATRPHHDSSRRGWQTRPSRGQCAFLSLH